MRRGRVMECLKRGRPKLARLAHFYMHFILHKIIKTHKEHQMALINTKLQISRPHCAGPFAKPAYVTTLYVYHFKGQDVVYYM